MKTIFITNLMYGLQKQKQTDREGINEMMYDILDKSLTEKQKQDKVKNLLYKLSKEGVIKNISGSRRKSIWVLKN